MKLSTINQIVETILSQNDDKAKLERNANEVTIALKMAMICESRGIEEAMDYYNKTHGPYEYLEYRTNVTKSDDISLCKFNKNTILGDETHPNVKDFGGLWEFSQEYRDDTK